MTKGRTGGPLRMLGEKGTADKAQVLCTGLMWREQGEYTTGFRTTERRDRAALQP